MHNWIVDQEMAAGAAARAREKNLNAARKVDKPRLDAGRKLFGADPRWNTNGAAGTLGRKSKTTRQKGQVASTVTQQGKTPSQFAVGDHGSTEEPFRILNVVSKTECLVMPLRHGSQPMLIRGVDTSKATDGVEFILQHPVVIQETYRYVAPSAHRKRSLCSTAIRQ